MYLLIKHSLLMPLEGMLKLIETPAQFMRGVFREFGSPGLILWSKWSTDLLKARLFFYRCGTLFFAKDSSRRHARICPGPITSQKIDTLVGWILILLVIQTAHRGRSQGVEQRRQVLAAVLGRPSKNSSTDACRRIDSQGDASAMRLLRSSRKRDRLQRK